MSDKDIRPFIIISVAGSFSLLIHLSLILIFYQIGAYPLALLNILSVVAWCAVMLLNYRGSFARAIELSCLEVLIHSIACVSLLGVESGFQHYLWAISCIVFLDSRFNFLGTIAISFCFISIYALLYVLFSDVEYSFLYPELQRVMHAANIAIAGVSLSFSIAVTKKVTLALERELQLQASCDGLTGLYNRRFLSILLAKQCALADRSGMQCSLVMIDLDHFKRINDTFGHNEGDKVLRDVSRILSDNIRSEDSAGRWGGEEFLILLPDSEGEQALLKTDQLRQMVAQHFVSEQVPYPVTLSAGICQWKPGMEADGWIQCADQALYESKHQGRNRCTLK